jgi:hypothetical protein
MPGMLVTCAFKPSASACTAAELHKVDAMGTLTTGAWTVVGWGTGWDGARALGWYGDQGMGWDRDRVMGWDGDRVRGWAGACLDQGLHMAPMSG